jgi:DNA repair exonuclease SbcCD ATPase subunit
VKILRLRLRNYRGIVEREITPAGEGVTVVVGPNEIGKSSLAEAIDLLFDELDSTTKRRVRNVQPVDRDAATEIEIDVETGGYAFTYTKRFQRGAATQLEVRRPFVENWTGREAHARAKEILDETIDTDLWRALRVQQGQGLEQASWLGTPALSAALDRAAGAAGGAQGETLFEAAEAEHARYFTRAGRERRELATAAREAERAQRAEQAAAEALARLEEDVCQAAELRALGAHLEHADREAERALRAEELAFEPIGALREALATAEARRDAALAEEREAVQALRQRSQLQTAHAAAEADLAQRAEDIESGEPALLGAHAELAHAERALAGARAAVEAASQDDSVRRADLAYRRAERELALLRERRERLQAARAAVVAARLEIEALPIDEACVREIGDAERAVERAQARVESEGPLVQLTAHTELRASLDGRSVELAEGELLERRVAESLLLSVPGVVDVTVVAGAGVAARVKTLEEARTRWRGLCAECGVDGHAGAVRALAARREAERRLEEHEQLADELRGPESEARLDLRVAEAEEHIRTYLSGRARALSLPPDAQRAEARVAEAHGAMQQARRAFFDAEQRRDALRERHRQLSDRHRETAVRLELAEQHFRDLDERLARARTDRSDEAAEEELEKRAAKARQLEAAGAEARGQLADAAPQAAELRLEQQRSERERCARELAKAREEAAHVSARLEVRGEAGLYEQLGQAQGERERRESDHAGLARRARAARLLLATLREERERARRGYAEPLERRIEEIGRQVFGESFQVELDEELRVSRRILDGVSLPFDQLSAGAREQIALLVRLAVARLVGREGGAPVILDDALGHSDAERLASIGRTLSRAAADCQILVLTCTPERYRHVEGARVVQLS